MGITRHIQHEELLGLDPDKVWFFRFERAEDAQYAMESFNELAKNMDRELHIVALHKDMDIREASDQEIDTLINLLTQVRSERFAERQD